MSPRLGCASLTVRNCTIIESEPSSTSPRVAQSSGTTSCKLAEDGRQELPDVHIGQQRLAELKHDCLFSSLAIGEVSCDLGEPFEFAAGVTNGGEDDVRPKARAILAHTPAFVFNSSSLCRSPQ